MTWWTPKIYRPAKFHPSTPIHARDIRYQNPADRKTNKQKNSNQYIPAMPIMACGDNKYASYPDWHISPHADRRHTNSLQQWPSPTIRRLVSHTTHGPRLSSQVCRTRLTTIQCVVDFSIFDLGGLPLGRSSPKGEVTS